MSKQSGEQVRRVLKGASARQRYDQTMMSRDKLRVVKALRDTANRLEAEAKSGAAQARAGAWTPGEIAVTDHAVLRFLERVMRLDIDAVRDEIARLIPRSKLERMKGSPGLHDIHVRDGFQFLITPQSVISVLSPGMEARDWLEREDLEAFGAA